MYQKKAANSTHATVGLPSCFKIVYLNNMPIALKHSFPHHFRIQTDYR